MQNKEMTYKNDRLCGARSLILIKFRLKFITIIVLTRGKLTTMEEPS